MKMTLKTKLALVLLNAFVATILFYKASLGINSLLFASYSAVLFLILKKNDSYNRFFTILFVITGISLSLVPQTMSFVVYVILGLLITGSQSHAIRNTSYHLVQGLVDELIALPNLIPTSTTEKSTSQIDYKSYLPVLITLPVVVIFFVLYKSGNPIFDFYTNKIDFSFIEIGSILFFLIASYLSVAFLFGGNRLWIKSASNSFQYIKNNEQEVNPLEFKTFKTLIITLIVLLALFHLSDISGLLAIGIPEELTLSQFVHQGFWTLVSSIILSISMVLFFFRDQLSFHPDRKKLLLIANIWLALNVVLVLSTCFKNTYYILEYGLTYRRVTVYAFLVFCLLLITLCHLKIQRNYQISVFISKSFSVALIYTIILSLCPWDTVITQYNLSGISKQCDLDYLLTLQHNNAILYRYASTQKVNTLEKTKISRKIETSKKLHQNKKWTSWSLIEQIDNSIPLGL